MKRFMFPVQIPKKERERMSSNMYAHIYYEGKIILVKKEEMKEEIITKSTINLKQ